MALRVSLFVTCVVDQLFPKVGMAMAEVLERAGCEVDFPDAQTCCGQPAFDSGFRDEARDIARYFLSVFSGADYIVVPSGSCCSMISHHFEELFPKEPKTLEGVHALARMPAHASTKSSPTTTVAMRFASSKSSRVRVAC